MAAHYTVTPMYDRCKGIAPYGFGAGSGILARQRSLAVDFFPINLLRRKRALLGFIGQTIKQVHLNRLKRLVCFRRILVLHMESPQGDYRWDIISQEFCHKRMGTRYRISPYVTSLYD